MSSKVAGDDRGSLLERCMRWIVVAVTAPRQCSMKEELVDAMPGTTGRSPKDSGHEKKFEMPSDSCDSAAAKEDPMPDDLEEALHWLDRQGSEVDCSDYASLLRKCGNVKAVELGKCVHKHISGSVHAGDRFLRNLLIEMYGKFGRLEECSGVFYSLRRPNVFSWTLMIAAYAQNGHPTGAIQLFQEMNVEGIKPDMITFIIMLDACATLLDLRQGKFVHECIVADGLESEIVLGNTLINMYGKCRSLDDAKNMFERMEQQRDVVSWNALIAAYAQNGYNKEALLLFQSMELEGIKANDVTFTACASAAGILPGKLIHARILSSGFQSDVIVMNALVNMHAKSNSVEDARLVFDEMGYRDVVSWNSMITAYAQARNGKEALDLLKRMDLEGFQPNEITFVSIADACANLGDLLQGRMIHELIVSGGFDSDMVVGNSLVNMYGKCGSLDDARDVFDELPSKNVVSWNAMLAAYAQNGYGKEALKLFNELDLEGMKANPVTFVSIIDACATIPALADGKSIHERVVAGGFESHVVVGTALVNMYGKCQSLEVARRLLEKLQLNEMVSWNAMISAYAQHGHGQAALEVLREMDLEGVKPNDVTFIGVLDACACLLALPQGKAMHARVAASGFDSEVAVGNTLINMYGKCGSREDARALFDRMHQRDVVSWSAIIAAYAQQGHAEEALQLFQQMQQEGVKPKQATLVTILDACGNSTALPQGKAIHASIGSCLSSDIVRSALVDMYGKCGGMKEARAVFDSMSCRSIVTWTAMLAAYAHHGHATEALQLFQEMQQEGVTPDNVTYASVVFACSHGGLLKEAFHQFASMMGDYSIAPKAEHYTCMIDVLGRLGRLREAEEVLDQMPFEPDGLAWMTLLGACKIHGDIERGARAAEHDTVDAKEAGPYVLLSNIYAFHHQGR